MFDVFLLEFPKNSKSSSFCMGTKFSISVPEQNFGVCRVCRVWGFLEFRVCRVEGSGFRVYVFGFRVLGFRV